jgi:hypothetical protein
MSQKSIARWTAWLGTIAAFLVFLLVGFGVATGVSQEYFEGVHPAAEYAERLMASAQLLRVDFALDNLFILAYGSFFVGLAIVLRGPYERSVVHTGLAAMLAVAVLDMVENHHIMAMADAATLGSAPSDGEIRLQAILSLIKFHLSCLGALLFAMAFPKNTTAGRWCAGLLLAYAFFGVLVLTAPPQWLDLLALIRTVFFVVAFVLTSRVLWNLDGAVD